MPLDFYANALNVSHFTSVPAKNMSETVKLMRKNLTVKFILFNQRGCIANFVSRFVTDLSVECVDLYMTGA